MFISWRHRYCWPLSVLVTTATASTVLIIAVLICLLIFCAYHTLGRVRHMSWKFLSTMLTDSVEALKGYWYFHYYAYVISSIRTLPAAYSYVYIRYTVCNVCRLLLELTVGLALLDTLADPGGHVPQTSDDFLYCENRFQDKLAGSSGCDNAKKRSAFDSLTRGSGPGSRWGLDLPPDSRYMFSLRAHPVAPRLWPWTHQWLDSRMFVRRFSPLQTTSIYK